MSPPLRFNSKVDAWLLVVVPAAVAACAVAMLMLAVRGPAWTAVGLLAIALPGIVLPLWVVCDTRYELTDEALRVRSGPFRWRVALRDVRAVAPSRSLLSSPALSLDRLRIDHGRAASLLVSPKDRENFLTALRSRCPGLAPSGPTDYPTEACSKKS